MLLCARARPERPRLCLTGSVNFRIEDRHGTVAWQTPGAAQTKYPSGRIESRHQCHNLSNWICAPQDPTHIDGASLSAGCLTRSYIPAINQNDEIHTVHNEGIKNTTYIWVYIYIYIYAGCASCLRRRLPILCQPHIGCFNLPYVRPERGHHATRQYSTNRLSEILKTHTTR